MGFQQGLSGLNVSSQSLDVYGNNIANSTTVGFKASSAQFADVYASSLYGTSGLQIGIGAKISDVAQAFSQGNIAVTENPLDIAVSGEGFFRMLKDGIETYTRNGQFYLDKDGYVINSSLQQLTGYIADSTGAITGGTPVAIQLSLAPSPPQVTSQLTVDLNLDSQESALAVAIDPADADTYHFSTSVTVFDEAGNDHGLVLYFQKTASNNWDVDGYINGTQIDLDHLNADSTMELAFNTDGTINTINGAAAAVFSLPAIAAGTLGTGAGALTITSTDFTGFTQYGTSSGVSFVSQDGYASGRIAGVSVDREGIIQGRYTNGQTRTLGQVIIHSFLNPQGLQPQGGNQWIETADSGQPVTGAPGTGVLGFVQSGAVEESNVDITGELVNLILAQRLYQANAQSIRAQDQVLQTLVNLR